MVFHKCECQGLFRASNFLFYHHFLEFQQILAVEIHLWEKCNFNYIVSLTLSYILWLFAFNVDPDPWLMVGHSVWPCDAMWPHKSGSDLVQENGMPGSTKPLPELKLIIPTSKMFCGIPMKAISQEAIINLPRVIEAKTKWLPFSRQHFQIHFLEWKCMNFY